MEIKRRGGNQTRREKLVSRGGEEFEEEKGGREEKESNSRKCRSCLYYGSISSNSIFARCETWTRAKREKERKKGSNFRIRTRTIRLSRIVKLYVPLSFILACRDPRFEREGRTRRKVSLTEASLDKGILFPTLKSGEKMWGTLSSTLGVRGTFALDVNFETVEERNEVVDTTQQGGWGGGEVRGLGWKR